MYICISRGLQNMQFFLRENYTRFDFCGFFARDEARL